jgi:hypothetical protein
MDQLHGAPNNDRTANAPDQPRNFRSTGGKSRCRICPQPPKASRLKKTAVADLQGACGRAGRDFAAEGGRKETWKETVLEIRDQGDEKQDKFPGMSGFR